MSSEPKAVSQGSPEPDSVQQRAAQAEGAALKATSARASASAGLVLGGHLAGEGLRLVSNLILVRLLPREAFGIMLLVNVVLRGLQLFSDVGIGPSIVQSPHGRDPAWLNTAWTIQVIRGLCLLLAGVAISSAVASFYAEPLLADLLPVAALAALLAGFESTKVFSANRQLLLGKVVSLELTSRVVALIVTATWAFRSPSVWALVAGALTAALVRMLLTHVWLPGPTNRFHWSTEHARGLLRFGRWIFLSTLLMFAAGELDSLLLGKFTSMSQLGVYAIAIILARIPARALHMVGSRVVFPLYSQAYRDGPGDPGVFLRARRALLSVAGWALSGLIAGGPVLVHLLYPDSFAAAGWVLQILAAGIWFNAMETANSSALLARGRAGLLAAGSAAKLGFLALALPLGFWWGGLPLAVAAVAASEVARYLVSTLAARRHGFRAGRQDALLTLRIVLAASLAWLALRGAQSVDAHVMLQAGIVFAVCSLVWGTALMSLAKSGLARRAGA